MATHKINQRGKSALNWEDKPTSYHAFLAPQWETRIKIDCHLALADKDHIAHAKHVPVINLLNHIKIFIENLTGKTTDHWQHGAVNYCSYQSAIQIQIWAIHKMYTTVSHAHNK